MSSKHFPILAVFCTAGFLSALLLAGCGPGSTRAIEVEFSHPANTTLRLCVFTDQGSQLWCRDSDSGVLVREAMASGEYRSEFTIGCTGWEPFPPENCDCRCVSQTGTSVFVVPESSDSPFPVELGSSDAVFPCDCRPEPTPGPTLVSTATVLAPAITPVPIVTWVVEGIPADTRIYYLHENDFLPKCSKTEISITADGSTTYEECDVKHAGKLSVEALKRVVLAFEEYGFFNLTVDGNGCVIDMTRPPPPAATLVEKTDAGYSSVSITINGTSKTLRYYNGYSYLDYDGARGLAVLGVLVNAAKDLPAATPTAGP